MNPTPEQLQKIIADHKKWLNDEPDGSRANLSGANLSGADLSGADLSRADLSRADLSRANLSGANLSGADLSGADLSRADLSRADLSRADLSGANLSGADLSRADLSRADLSRANLDAKYQPVLQISGSMHPITMMGPGNIRIGCKVGTLQWWQANNVRLGKENSYSDGQIEEYAKYIELLAWRVEHHNKTTAITEKPSVV
jgi:hypothetical protein